MHGPLALLTIFSCNLRPGIFRQVVSSGILKTSHVKINVTQIDRHFLTENYRKQRTYLFGVVRECSFFSINI
jgi:hypothetical protein